MIGTHGTCGSYAKKIRAQGFDKPSQGLAGTGFYFWASYSQEELIPYAKSLAISWWEHKKTKGSYKSCEDQSCTVISATLKVNNGLFCDLESHDLKGRTISLVNHIYLTLPSDLRGRVALTRAYDLYVQMLEKEANMKIEIIHVAVKTPPCFNYSIDFNIRGLPGCYVVKDKNCINSLNFEKI